MDKLSQSCCLLLRKFRILKFLFLQESLKIKKGTVPRVCDLIREDKERNILKLKISLFG